MLSRTRRAAFSIQTNFRSVAPARRRIHSKEENEEKEADSEEIELEWYPASKKKKAPKKAKNHPALENLRIGASTRVIFQGLTGRQATATAEESLAWGTKIVGGTKPGFTGEHLGLPVLPSVRQAVEQLQPDASAIFVPGSLTGKAIEEAIEAEVPLIVAVAEHVPVHDMIRVHDMLKTQKKSRLVGPNSPGIISVTGKCRIGFQPLPFYTPGKVGIIAKSGTLSYEAVASTTRAGLGQTLCIGIGGDSLPGTNMTEALQILVEDEETEAIILIGEVGGDEEHRAAEWIREYHAKVAQPKPIAALVAGLRAPEYTVMGHAGAMHLYGDPSADAKRHKLHMSGVTMVNHPEKFGEALKVRLQEKEQGIVRDKPVRWNPKPQPQRPGSVKRGAAALTKGPGALRPLVRRGEGHVDEPKRPPPRRIVEHEGASIEHPRRPYRAIQEQRALVKQFKREALQRRSYHSTCARYRELDFEEIPRYLPENLHERVRLCEEIPPPLSGSQRFIIRMGVGVDLWSRSIRFFIWQNAREKRIWNGAHDFKRVPFSRNSLKYDPEAVDAQVTDDVVERLLQRSRWQKESARPLKYMMQQLLKTFYKTGANRIEIGAVNHRIKKRHNEWVLVSDMTVMPDDVNLPGPDDPAEPAPQKEEICYIRFEGDRNIGTLVNGAGLAMNTVDALADMGGRATNFLDTGGKATKETIKRSFEMILADERVKVIFVNIFGGITKGDVIAEGVLLAFKELDIKLPVVVRIRGTNEVEGQRIIAESGLPIFAFDSFEEAAAKTISFVHAENEIFEQEKQEALKRHLERKRLWWLKREERIQYSRTQRELRAAARVAEEEEKKYKSRNLQLEDTSEPTRWQSGPTSTPGGWQRGPVLAPVRKEDTPRSELTPKNEFITKNEFNPKNESTPKKEPTPKKESTPADPSKYLPDYVLEHSLLDPLRDILVGKAINLSMISSRNKLSY